MVNRSLCARFVIYALILWRHLPSSCCLNLVPPSVVVFNVLQISFSGFLPEPFKISKNGFLHITLHTSAQNILKLQVPRSKALGGVWAQSSKMSCVLYNNRLNVLVGSQKQLMLSKAKHVWDFFAQKSLKRVLSGLSLIMPDTVSIKSSISTHK